MGQRLITALDQYKSSFNYEVSSDAGQCLSEKSNGVRRLRQPQKRLTVEQTAKMCQKYLSGATVYELGREFGIDRRTVSIRLKLAGVAMRQTRPPKKTECAGFFTSTSRKLPAE